MKLETKVARTERAGRGGREARYQGTRSRYVASATLTEVKKLLWNPACNLD